MAWGSAKRRISGKIARGDFQKPDNTLQKGIMAAGDIAVSKILKAQEEERLEERRKKAAAAAEAKRLAAEQRKKEEEAQKLARQAKAIATRYGAQGNTEFINYATEQLYTFGDSAAALIESDYKSGRLAIGEKETGPMQGPLLQPMTDDELRIAENTTLDAYRAAEGDADPNTPDAKTNIVTSFKADGGIDAQMNSILDRTGALSDEQIASQTYEGITIDPDATETEKLDFTKIQTVADVDGALRNIKVNDINVDDKTLKELKNLRATYYARESAAWVAEASESADKAFAAMRRFEAQSDNTNYVIAKGIYTGWLNKDAPYKGLLDPEGLIGKSAQDLRDTKAVATSLGAKPEDFSVLDQLLESTEIVENDAKAQAYITGASSYNRTVAQIEAALASGDYKADDPLISHLNNIARKQQKQEIEKEVGVQGVVAVDGLYIDPETNEKTFAIIMRHPNGINRLRDGTVVDYIPLSETEASEFAKLSVQTQKYAQELVTSSTAIAEGLRNAENIIQIAKDDPRVRNAGGDVAQFVSGFARGTDSVLGVVQDIFADRGPDYVLTEDELRRELGTRGISDNVLTAALSDELLNLADKTAQFEAGVLALVFRSGRMEGQAGNAMSNKDFERLMQMLDVKGSVTAFENTVRNYMKEKILSYDDKAFGQDAAGAVAAFKKNFGWSPVQEALPFEDFVTQRNESTLTQSFNATMQYSPQATKTGGDETVGVTPTAMNAFLESGGGIKIGDAELKLTDVLGELKKYETQFQGDELVAKQQALITQIAKAAGITDEKAIANFAKIIGTKVLPTTK